MPQRTCVICRTVGGKRGLLRIVRTPDGHIIQDPTGRLAGRGAYICRAAECLNAALKGNQIEHVLKVKASAEDREQLKMSLGEFIKEQVIV